MASTGIDFEKLVRSIYEEMLSQESMDTIEVLHNTKVQGASGQSHQLDVFWSFKVAGVIHRVAVECKEYNKPISVGKVRDFSAALDDIGNISGIFVTTVGFQSGAVKFARHKNISLKILATPTQQDIHDHGGVSTIVLQAHALTVVNVKEGFEFDLDWAFKNTSLKYNDPITIAGLTNEIFIEDDEGIKLATILDLINALPRNPENSKGLKHVFEYDNAFLITPGCAHPRLKIKSAFFVYDTVTEESVSRIEYQILARNILKDFITGEAYLFGRTILPK